MTIDYKTHFFQFIRYLFQLVYDEIIFLVIKMVPKIIDLFTCFSIRTQLPLTTIFILNNIRLSFDFSEQYNDSLISCLRLLLNVILKTPSFSRFIRISWNGKTTVYKVNLVHLLSTTVNTIKPTLYVNARLSTQK